MIISESRKFVFVHTMKTAGDSITVALKPDLARADLVLKNDFQGWLLRQSGRIEPRYASLRKHSPASMIREQMEPGQWETLFTFAFVRHPIGKAISLYRYVAAKAESRQQIRPRNLWYLTPPGRADDPNRWPAMLAYRESASFSEFIRHPIVLAAPGMQPQSAFLSDGNGEIIVNFVGKFEQLADDMAKVQRTIGVDQRLLGRRNASGGGEGPSLQMSDDDRRHLVEWFRSDFERFEYDP